MKRHFLFLVLLAVSVLVHSAAGQSVTLRHTIPGPDGTQSGAQLGYSVAVDGNIAVVGAPSDDTLGGYESGVVKVFDAVNGTLLHVILNPSPAFYDEFGTAVAISGTRLVVGASRDDTGASDAGIVYVYDLSSGSPTVPVTILQNPSPASQDFFGSAVAISGTRVVVGVFGDDTGASAAGCAYVYNLASGTPAVPEAVLNNPDPTQFDSFGRSVSISGTRIVVGAASDDAGANDAGSAYVYDIAGGTPTVPVVTLNNPAPAAFDSFGSSVAISGTHVVVGAPFDDTGLSEAGSAYVYNVASGTPTVPIAVLNNPQPGAVDIFGSSVALFGTRVAVGALYDDTGASDAGSVYLYDLSGGTPTVPFLTLNNPTPGVFEGFGQSIAISGLRVVVGAPLDDTGATDAGSAYVYNLGGGTPTVPAATLNNPGPSIQNNFGMAVAVSGTRMVIGVPGEDTGATNCGRAYVYNLASGTPLVPEVILNNPTPAAFDQYGYSVAISGTKVVIGTLEDGTGTASTGNVYVYDVAGGSPTVPEVILTNPTPASYDNFGASVAIEGSHVVVGASGDDTDAANAGTSYVYDLSSDTPTTPSLVLPNPAPGDQDSFGNALAISGTRLVIGATGDDSSGDGAGSAYVFDLASGTPTVPIATLSSPVAEFTFFGSSLAIAGSRVVIGAPYASPATGGSGSAYVYDLASGTPLSPAVTLNNPGTAVGDCFGFSVAIFDTQVLVGASQINSGASNPGSAYLYSLQSATPTTPVATLSNPTPAAEDQFGLAVSIAGTVAVIGAPGDDSPLSDKGTVYVFDLPDSAGPTGGTFTIAPASPVAPTTTLTGTFASWSDPSAPLTYEIREGMSVIVAAGANAAPTFTLPSGSHSLTGRIYDSIGNFTEVGPVTVVVDGSAPVINTPGNLAVSATSTAGAEVTFGVSATDDIDQNPMVTVDFISGSIFPIGVTTVTVTAKDTVNNESTATFTVTVSVDAPLAAEIATTGAPVPGAGSDARIAAGAVWTGFSTPAINDAGEVAYIGKWKAPAVGGGAPAQIGTGIFVGETLLAKVGEALAEGGTLNLPANAVFKSLRDPVIDAAGHVSFIATIAGTGISAANDMVVMSDVDSGFLKVLAREGNEAPETDGAKFKSFANVSALGSATSGVLFTATLKSGSGNPRVTAATDAGVWWLPSGGSQVLNVTREGNPGFNGGETIKSVLVLSAVSGSTGQGRGLASGDRALLRLTLGGAVPRQAIVRAEPGAITEVAGTGSAIGGTVIPVATWKTLNLPASGNAGQDIAVLGILTPNNGGTGRADGKGIYVSANGGVDWEPLARMTNVAVGFSTLGGASYVSLSDPVISSTEASVAFMGTVKGGTVRNSDNAVIWWRPEGEEVAILAREGTQPPGAPAGAKWDSFTSLAFPGGGTGPLFTATLKRGAANGRITGKDDMGLYAADGTGAIQEVLREGQPLANLAGRTVKSFNILKAAAGTAGVTRAFNDNRQIAAHVTFSDNTSGVVLIQLP